MRKINNKIPLIFVSSGMLILFGALSYAIYTINNVIGVMFGIAVLLFWIGMVLYSIKLWQL